MYYASNIFSAACIRIRFVLAAAPLLVYIGLIKMTIFTSYRLACPCARFEEFRDPHLRNFQLEYYDELNELIETGRYDTRDDFTVVLQPLMVDMKPLTLVCLYGDRRKWYNVYIIFICTNDLSVISLSFA